MTVISKDLSKIVIDGLQWAMNDVRVDPKFLPKKLYGGECFCLIGDFDEIQFSLSKINQLLGKIGNEKLITEYDEIFEDCGLEMVEDDFALYFPNVESDEMIIEYSNEE